MALTTPMPTAPAASPAARAIPQYSLGRILGVWAAAALPMGFLAWIAAPWLADRLDTADPLPKALLVCLTLGLVWQFALVVLLVARERPASIRDALWLRAPVSPRSGRRGGRVWLVAVPFALLFAAEQLIPMAAHATNRDLGLFLGTDAGHAFLSGAWGWFALIAVLAVFNTVLGEELLFRGLLLPRMNGVFGRGDWLANGVLFAVYHLHMPWAIPGALVDALALAYPSKRYRSAWMGIIVHSTQSVVIVGLCLALVLR
jgi:membrane protease YdiL (CAAX protease family)